VEFLIHLGELDRRKLFLEMAHSLLFAYCVDGLGLSRSSAFRRTTAARLVTRFPIVASYLENGRVSMSALVELRDVLNDERHREILDRATGMNEDQAKRLAAELRPQPPALPMIRALPTAAPAPEPPAPVNSAGPALSTASTSTSRPTMTPVCATRHIVRLTVSDDFRTDLERLRGAMSHQIPDRDLERVLHHCIKLALAEQAKRRRGTGERYIPAAVRDEVWQRDEGRCTYVGLTGQRCRATRFLDFHHVIPFAKNGPATAENLTLHCRAHNGHQAVIDGLSRA
jgi:5-methylcytosine-specific restriction endonuclease McrA